MTDALECWKCGASLAVQLLPLGRLAECDACRAQLHVCRLCRFYNPRVSNACEEPVADLVTDKERANFCGYFEPRPGAYRAQAAATREVHARLKSLFDDDASDTTESTESDARRRLDELFNKK